MRRQRFRSAGVTAAVVATLVSVAAPGLWLATASAAAPDPANRPKTDPAKPQAEAIRLAIEDLSRRFGDRYPGGAAYLRRLAEIEAMDGGPERSTALRSLRREALLANPLLDFDRILLVRRKRIDVSKSRAVYYRVAPREFGLPLNFNGNSDLPRGGWANQLVTLEGFADPDRPAMLKEVYRPDRDVLVCDVDLHWDADRLLFSSVDETGHWHVYEINVDGSGLRKVTPDELSERGVDSYDACYLPDGRIVFASTATEQSVPCGGGSEMVANLCRMNTDGTGIRRLCFDQDQNWTPAVTEQGTVIYSRWQYTDQPHRYGRVLMHMNPDGTNQREFYGGNSYWPNAIYCARAIPGEPSRFVATVGGHHGLPRMGEMILFDRTLGQRQSVEPGGPARGVVQRITDRGETVKAVLHDKLIEESWPRFLHPFPLDGSYFLAAAQPAPDRPWGLYLVDVFDNMVLLHEERGQLMFEPIPVAKRPVPPVVPDRVDLSSKTATIYISDIYEGPGLAGVPRGSVKELRIFTYNYPPMFDGLRGNTSTVNALGIATSWDIHAILGRVPVEPDGSASFVVPANTPLSLQPLDAEGKAMQLMRNWMTAMPGETLGCVGCHEQPDTVPPPMRGAAFRRAPSPIAPRPGRVRGFDYRRDVQPVIDRRCVGCHQGPDKPDKPDLRGEFVDESIARKTIPWPRRSRVYPQDVTWSYYNLQRLVHRPTGEGEIPVLNPMEHHAEVSELVQLLRKGHHGVTLTDDEWRAIATWIDMNAPFYGRWEDAPRVRNARASLERRAELLKRFAGVDWDLHATPDATPEPVAFVRPAAVEAPGPAPRVQGWPLSPQQAAELQSAGGEKTPRTIRFGDGGELELAWIPPGTFVMGSNDESPAERPMSPVRVQRGFWMSVTEIDNRTFRMFDPEHHSRFLTGACETLDSRRIESLDGDAQPVVRVSWREAMAFCRWLSERTGEDVDLPTEAQWEWACRAGSEAGFPAWTAKDKGKGVANCAGVSLGTFHDWKSLPFRAFDPVWDDGLAETDKVHRNRPNAWGLKNMHGNAAEWTRSLYKPYPYDEADGRNDPDAKGKRVVRGGSFSDRPKRCTASYRLGYRSWQGVYNVGFRVILRPRQGESNGS